MKRVIYIGAGTGGCIFGWLGSLLDHGNGLGPWSMLGGLIGSLLGIWVGYKLASYYNQ